MNIEELLINSPDDKIIKASLIKSYNTINNPKYKKILCSISGGSDSDIVLDICTKCDNNKKIEYVWFDTGLEYQATKEHLKYLENKYGIEIKVEKAIKPIPVACKEYGQPFISKKISDAIKRLQEHNFKWEDKPYEDLLKEYCRWDEKKKDFIGCKMAIRWWCNEWGDKSRFNICYNKYLKEFIIANPPKFNISDVCCTWAKKKIFHNMIKGNNYDLNIMGVRKAEGGARASAYKSCFDEHYECDNFRPVFWYLNNTKSVYDNYYNVVHSNCYTEYKLKRTGCAGCPFGREFQFELDILEKYEPNLYKGVNNIFKDSYEYTRKYKEFIKEKNEETKIKLNNKQTK